MGVLSILLTAGIIASHVMMAAGNSEPVQKELAQMAAMLPWEEVSAMYLDRGKVEDYNGDGMPEVYLTAAGGWEYRVYYYWDGEMRTVEELAPWTWTSSLYHTANGQLVLYAEAHTTGTEGTVQYRIYEWTKDGYCLTEDLWSFPEESDGNGTLLSCRYFLSETAIDPFPYEEEELAALEISKEEFEQKVNDLGEMTSVFEDGLEGGFDFWQENDYEDVSVTAGIYREIQEEILNWQ